LAELARGKMKAKRPALVEALAGPMSWPRRSRARCACGCRTRRYWRIWFYLLEAAGLDVQLVNARDAKNLPGRPKTDKLDAWWPV
jgi:transposase